jgi:hypothetical protein
LVTSFRSLQESGQDEYTWRVLQRTAHEHYKPYKPLYQLEDGSWVREGYEDERG